MKSNKKIIREIGCDWFSLNNSLLAHLKNFELTKDSIDIENIRYNFQIMINKPDTSLFEDSYLRSKILNFGFLETEYSYYTIASMKVADLISNSIPFKFNES